MRLHRMMRHRMECLARERFGFGGPGFGGRDGEEHGRGRFGREGGRFGGGRMGRRVFDHGDLRFVVLQLIAEKPSHGYEIIKAIEERLHGSYSPSPGAIYPTLTLLEELGHVTVSNSEGSRKLYTITPEGQQFLDGNRPTVDGIFARLDEASESGASGRAPQIMRAMHNLKLALRLRVTNGPLSKEQIAAITAALDDAVKAIENT